MRYGLLITGLALGTILFFPEKSVTYGPGIVAPDWPVQTNITNGEKFPLNGYELTKLASMKITARVLSKEDYSYDRESDLAPIDLALGWRQMSDETILDHFSISQGARWMNWTANFLPIPMQDVTRQSANMHMIPASDEIKDQLEDIYKGQVVELTGFLIRARASDGWRWSSSMSREDTGSHACEVFYVEQIVVVKGND